MNSFKRANQKKYLTRSGFAELSKYSIFIDHNLHSHFRDKSWFELNLYGITQREFTKSELKLLNYIWVSTSYSDLRIWPNRIVALSASTKTTPLLALTGGLASCDAELFVSQPLVNCLDMLTKMNKQIKQGCSLKSLIDKKLEKKETIFGFGRPITSVDERVPHFIKFLKEEGFIGKDCFKLAINIENYLKTRKGIQMNIAALYSATCADLGFTKEQMGLFVSLLVFAGMPPCYREGSEKPELSVLPLSIQDINYTGEKDKSW